MFQSSISYGIQSVYELENGLGRCIFKNLVVDLLQEAPYLSALVKADSDSGVNRAEKIYIYVEEPLVKCWLFASVGETD